MTPVCEVLDQSYRELTQFFPSPGEVEHDPDEIARLAVATLRDVARRVREAGHEVVAIGITNQRETTVGFDREPAAPFQRAIVWQDRRTAALCQALEDQGSRPRRASDDRPRPRLVFFGHEDALDARPRRRRRSDGSRASRPSTRGCSGRSPAASTGASYATEPSNASRTMLMDLTSLDWSAPMLALFGVASSMLADVRPSASRFGTVSPDVAPELAGVPITGMLGDQQSALFGQACFSPGLVKATYGTGAFVLANAGTSVPEVVDGLVTTVAWDLGAFGPASYALEGSAFVAGAAIQWLRDLGIIAASG